jgi:hypothetical protein
LLTRRGTIGASLQALIGGNIILLTECVRRRVASRLH